MSSIKKLEGFTVLFLFVECIVFGGGHSKYILVQQTSKSVFFGNRREEKNELCALKAGFGEDR